MSELVKAAAHLTHDAATLCELLTQDKVDTNEAQEAITSMKTILNALEDSLKQAKGYFRLLDDIFEDEDEDEDEEEGTNLQSFLLEIAKLEKRIAEGDQNLIPQSQTKCKEFLDILDPERINKTAKHARLVVIKMLKIGGF